jgi:hypothetical protein
MEEKSFVEWYLEIPQSKFKPFRGDVMQYCEVSKDVLATWANGRVEVPAAARPIINFIATKYGIAEPFDVPFQIIEKI